MAHLQLIELIWMIMKDGNLWKHAADCRFDKVRGGDRHLGDEVQLEPEGVVLLLLDAWQELGLCMESRARGSTRWLLQSSENLHPVFPWKAWYQIQNHIDNPLLGKVHSALPKFLKQDRRLVSLLDADEVSADASSSLKKCWTVTFVKSSVSQIGKILCFLQTFLTYWLSQSAKLSYSSFGYSLQFLLGSSST